MAAQQSNPFGEGAEELDDAIGGSSVSSLQAANVLGGPPARRYFSDVEEDDEEEDDEDYFGRAQTARHYNAPTATANAKFNPSQTAQRQYQNQNQNPNPNQKQQPETIRVKLNESYFAKEKHLLVGLMANARNKVNSIRLFNPIENDAVKQQQDEWSERVSSLRSAPERTTTII